MTLIAIRRIDNIEVMFDDEDGMTGLDYSLKAIEHPPRCILAQPTRTHYSVGMTGLEIIEEIKRLPSDERQKVLEFARANFGVRQLTGKEIAELTRKMVDTPDPAEAARLQEEIVRGFYGAEPHA